MYLPDVNVWLALVFEAHQHHKSAAGWFEALSPMTCAFCRFSQQGLLRLSSNPAVFRDEARTVELRSVMTLVLAAGPLRLLASSIHPELDVGQRGRRPRQRFRRQPTRYRVYPCVNL